MMTHAKTIITQDKLATLQEVGADKAQFDKTYDTLKNELTDAVADLVADDASDWTPSKIKILFFDMVKYYLRGKFLDT